MRGTRDSWLGTRGLRHHKGLFPGCRAGELLAGALGAEWGWGHVCGHWVQADAVSAWLQCGGLWPMVLGCGTPRQGHLWAQGLDVCVCVSAAVGMWVQVERSCPWCRGCTWAQAGRWGCSTLPVRSPALPTTGQLQKNFMKYSLCCLSPLALGLMELLVPAMQPPANSFPLHGLWLNNR